MKEYVIGTRNLEGEITYGPRFYSSYEECKEWYDYLCGPWREELKEEVKKEKEKNKKSKGYSNWAYMTWKSKKDLRRLIMVREVSPFTILEEEGEVV